MKFLRIGTLIVTGFFLGFTTSAFMEGRDRLLYEMEGYSREANFVNILLDRYSQDCDKFNYGQYYAFQDHALTRYEGLLSKSAKFPYLLRSDEMTVHYDSIIFYRENWASTNMALERC